MKKKSELIVIVITDFCLGIAHSDMAELNRS